MEIIPVFSRQLTALSCNTNTWQFAFILMTYEVVLHPISEAAFCFVQTPFLSSEHIYVEFFTRLFSYFQLSPVSLHVYHIFLSLQFHNSFKHVCFFSLH